MLVSKTGIKEICEDMSISSDFYPAIEEKVKQIIKEACNRASANSRRTVMGKDL